jgi:hypothetical protein
LRKKNKEEVEGETTRDKYITHTESFSIQLKNPTQKGRGEKKHTHTHTRQRSKSNQVLAQQTNTHTQPSCQGFDAEELSVERFMRVFESFSKL